MRTGGRRIHPGSLGSLGCDLWVIGFIRCRWIHWGAPWGLTDSLEVAEFVWVRSGVLWVRSGSLSSLGYAVGSCGSSGVPELICVCPNSR